ncbi:lengsin [Engraulis encrasicolus]|uniref:lengsin n=1 Tax=Engraulis encrasicolus TaxID=184585 RepID=UPI002FD4623E
MSRGNKKGVKISSGAGDRYRPHQAEGERRRRGNALPLVQTTIAAPGGNPTIISIGPHDHRGAKVSPGSSRRSLSFADSRDERSSFSHARASSYCGDGGGAVPRQTLEELKTMLDQRDGGHPGSPYTYLHPGGGRPDGQPPDEVPSRAFSTFKPFSSSSESGGKYTSRPTDRSSFQTPSTSHWDSSSGSTRADVHSRSSMRSPSCEATTAESQGSQTDNGNGTGDSNGPQHFITFVEQIKQQIDREGVNFVRFEATDLHGVSRSKIVPARFFSEKAAYGVPMPRSYLELTLSPKINEVDNGAAANFSSDILLVPDMATFKILPWANHTGRVICDPCTVTGVPLRTSPRLIAKQQLAQLQQLGFTLHSAMTYECCVLGLPERVGSKAVFFPATTLLSNNDLPFLHQLISGMYHMGVDVDSFASASGPGQMEIALKPKFGIAAADCAFTFRTGMKEMARKHNYIASFFTDDGMYNAGVFSHSLWDANGRRSLFHSGSGGGSGELAEIGRKWLAGLLHHSAALSCLLAPGVGCRNQLTKGAKDTKKQHALYATYGCNDNSCSFNLKFHGGREAHIDNKLGSAMANPYVVMAATVAAGLDGLKRGLSFEYNLNRAPNQQKQFGIQGKLEDALEALAEDEVIRGALGETFTQYFIAIKKLEIETQELDAERNKTLEYFI